MISLLHPSRSRIDKSKATIDKWLSRADADVELIISIDSDDPQKELYLEAHKGHKIIINDNRSAVDAINNAAKECTGDIMIVVSDDTDVPIHWVNKILVAVQGRSDYILKVYDGIQKWIITMPVMDRTYYNRFGYIYHPDYRHCFCDTEMTHIADILKKIIWRNDILFEHQHYCVGKAQKDAINERADASWNQGKELYLRRVMSNFNIENINVFDINNESHLNWLNNSLNGK